MKLNWKSIADEKPKHQEGENFPYISCIVYACNPTIKVGGVIETCRWDVKNNCWFWSDIKRNWYLGEPYRITHFVDDAKGPF